MLFNRNSMPLEAPLNPNDFPRVAKDMGFSFSLRRGRVDWYKIDGISIDRIVQERDLSTLQENLLHIVNYNLDSEYDVKILDQNFVKLFRLAQLSVDYLLYSEQHLFNCIELLREQLAKSAKDIEKFKAEIKKREEDIKCLKKKMKDKSHEPHNAVNDIEAYFKCTHCGKTFSNSSYLSSHLLRRHPATTMVSEPAEVNKSENEVLRLEIKQLKERLNNTDRLLQNDKLKQMQSFGRDGKFDQMLEKLNKKYVEEITSMTNTFQSEIQKLKDTKPDTKNHQELMTKIQKQELEIQRLQEQVSEKSSPKMEVRSGSGQLEAQEQFWTLRLNSLEDKYVKQMEEMKTFMNENERKITRNYETKIEELITKTAKQDELLKIQEKQVQQLLCKPKTTNLDSKLNADNDTSHLKNTKLSGNNSNPRAAFRNRTLKHLNESPKTKHNLEDLEQVPQNVTQPVKLDTISTYFEQPEMETVILPESFTSEKQFQAEPSNVSDQVAKEPLEKSNPRNMQQENVNELLINNPVPPETSDILTLSSSDSSESNENVEYTDVQYFPIQQSSEQQNHVVSVEPENVSNKLQQSKSEYVDNFIASTEDDEPDSLIQSPPKKSASCPATNQQPKFDEIRRVQSSSKPSNMSNYDGWNKVVDSRETQIVSQSKRHNSKHLEKEDFDDHSVEEDEEENSMEESEQTDSDDNSLARQTSNELALHSVHSLEQALAKNPQVLEEFKLDIKQQFDQRLREFGIDPEWKGIPQATYKHNMETLKHHQTITAKKYPSFFKVKQKLVNSMEKRLGLSINLDGGGSGDTKLRGLTQNTPVQKMKRFDKVVGSVKRKALGIFERTKNVRKTDQASSKSFVNKRVAQNQRRKNLQLTHSRMHLNFRENENLSPVTTSTPLKASHLVTRLKDQVLSSSDESQDDSDEAANNLQGQNCDKVQTLWPEIHTPPTTQIQSSLFTKPNTHHESPEKTKLSNQMSKSQDFLHRRMSHRESTKSALKSSLSTGSLTKKRVIFSDQDIDKESTWDSSQKNIRKSVQFTDEVTQPVLMKASVESHSDWEPSSDEYEIDQPSKKNDHINLSTKQSDKIALISRDIEQQLSRTRTKPPGGVEAMPHDTSTINQQDTLDISSPQTVTNLPTTAKSDVSKPPQHPTRTKQSVFNQSPNAFSSHTAVPIPVPRQKDIVLDDWDLEDLDDIMSD